MIDITKIYTLYRPLSLHGIKSSISNLLWKNKNNSLLVFLENGQGERLGLSAFTTTEKLAIWRATISLNETRQHPNLESALTNEYGPIWSLYPSSGSN